MRVKSHNCTDTSDSPQRESRSGSAAAKQPSGVGCTLEASMSAPAALAGVSPPPAGGRAISPTQLVCLLRTETFRRMVATSPYVRRSGSTWRAAGMPGASSECETGRDTRSVLPGSVERSAALRMGRRCRSFPGKEPDTRGPRHTGSVFRGLCSWLHRWGRIHRCVRGPVPFRQGSALRL